MIYSILANTAQLKNLPANQEHLFKNYSWKDTGTFNRSIVEFEESFKEAKELFIALESARVTCFKNWPNE